MPNGGGQHQSTSFHAGGWFRPERLPFTEHPPFVPPVETVTQFHPGGWFMNRRSPFTDHPPFVPPELPERVPYMLMEANGVGRVGM